MVTPKQVLVIDDDADVVNGTCLRLRSAGYTTVCAKDGQTGVSMAVGQQPDVILLDVRMPQMDGLTALEQLHKSEKTKHIPVVMLSASLVDQQAALEAGARYFLTKPYDGQTLLTAVRAAATKSSDHADFATTDTKQSSNQNRPTPTFSADLY